MTNTCFVIMPIGTQTIGAAELTEVKLREKYDYIIKNAIQQADPSLEVIRADEELNPGSISNDIFTKLMHSKYVIADITYPNPNVFYELGIRHAISSRTILIREKSDINIPFDISHLRYIEYTQNPGGMELLRDQLKTRFKFYETNPGKLDNQFLELCNFTNFIPEVFAGKRNNEKDLSMKMLSIVLSKPELLQPLMYGGSEEEKQQALLKAVSEDPATFLTLMNEFV